MPSFFDCHVLKHHGYDFATWSLLGSDLREVDGEYVVNGDKLRFIHFSGLDSGTIDKAIGWWLNDDNRGTFVQLYQQYLSLLGENGQATLGKTPWSYGTYASGDSISNKARIAYRDRDLWQQIPKPFDASDEKFPIANEVAATIEPAQKMPVSLEPPSILNRFLRSTLDIGLGPTMTKAVRRLSSGAGRRPQ